MYFFAEGTDIPEELLLPRYQLQELCSEAAKLKNLGAMEAIPSDRLVRLLSILEKNIRAAEKMSLLGDPVSITKVKMLFILVSVFTNISFPFHRRIVKKCDKYG